MPVDHSPLERPVLSTSAVVGEAVPPIRERESNWTGGTLPDSSENEEKESAGDEENSSGDSDSEALDSLNCLATAIGWFSSSTAAGYAISVFVHCVIMAGLSVVVLPEVAGFTGINTLMTYGEARSSSQNGFDKLPLETRIDLEGGEFRATAKVATSEENGLETMAPSSDLGGFMRVDLLPTTTTGKGATVGNGAGASQGDGVAGALGGFSMPSSGKVVTKGNFSAWTVPEDPKPGENYLIVIQVALPKRYTLLPQNDVTGMVVGTDGYRLRINAYTSSYYPKTKQLVIRVPGAEQKVRDTIHVTSQLLKESQELRIEF